MLRSAAAALSAVLALCLAAGPAGARDLGIAAFYGDWEGSGISESNVSVYFQMTSRDIGVTVRPAGDGFTITWKTVQRQKGDPNDPREELKSTSMTFVPSGDGLWRSTDNGDPMDAGRPYAWAYIEDSTLVLKSLQIYPDGRHEVQVYRRTLSGTGMELEFVRTVDGEPVRTAEGRLIKVAN